MKHTVILLAALSLAAAFGCKKTGVGGDAFIVQNYFGTVNIQGPGGGRLPEIGGPVSEADTVVTGPRSSVDLVYNESSLIRVNENTTLGIDSLMAKVENSTELTLRKGSLFTTVQKLKKQENFQVNTPTMVVAVRGTSFGVSADENSSRAEVLAGTVKVNPVKDGTVVSEVTSEVTVNNLAEIKKEQIREIIEKRKMAIAPIRAERMKRLRADLEGIDGAVVDRLNPELRKEFRMKILKMKQERFEQMESGRDERIKKFLEMKKAKGARIRERFAEADTEEKREALRKEWLEKKESVMKERLEKRRAMIEEKMVNKEGARERLIEKRKELMEKRDAIIEERRKAAGQEPEKSGGDRKREMLKKMLEKRKKSQAETPTSL